MEKPFVRAPNPGRLRRKFREKIFVYSMILMAVLFVYVFGYRPEWLYGIGPTIVGNDKWWIDIYAHGVAGIGLSWIFVYGFRLSLDSPTKRMCDVVVYSTACGSGWEFAIEWSFDDFLRPIFFSWAEKLQKGEVDTNADMLAVFLGSILGLLIWKFVWRSGYIFFFPESAKEEYLDELAENAARARREAKRHENTYREKRNAAIRAKKGKIKQAIRKKLEK